MGLVNYREVLQYAKEHKITVGAFNSMNMETVQAVAAAAENKRTPLIIQTYHAHVDYAGPDYIRAIAQTAAERSNVKIALGWDHGRSDEQAKKCIESGYSGVMIDLASEDYELNVRETKRVVELAHKVGVSVEAELGTIVTADETPEVIAEGCTDPVMARRFVKDTGIDCLAVSVGTAHGAYKYAPKIQFDLLKELVDTVECPIVVHGGSGTPDEDVEKMVRLGIAKLNVGTEFFTAYIDAVKEMTKGDSRPDIIDMMRAARDAVRVTADAKLDILTRFRV